MTRKITFVLATIFTLAFISTCFVGCTAREKQLKIYNWGDYMDPDVIAGFEEWYFEQTQETVKVVYKAFDTNEALYDSVATKKKDWDLVCPSDYMIEKLINEGLAQKIDTSIIDFTKDDLVDEYLIGIINSICADGKAMEYTIPYVWGTFGIMYDSTRVAHEDAEFWSIFWSDKYKNEMYMKDSVRDAYAVAAIYANTDKLSAASNGFTDYSSEEYKTLLNDIFKKFDDESIAVAKEKLIEQKPLLKQYEVDNGKTEMYAGNGKLGLFWSCDAGFVMNDIETEARGCVPSKIMKGNKNLFYTVPKEGSNIWIDGWVIPTYAKNTKAANYFLKYLMETENSIANAQYAGAPTPNKAAMLEYKAMLELDEDGFFDGAPEGFFDMYMQMMFPPQEVLERCAVMGDLGEKYYPIFNQMWVDVKSSQTK